MGAARVCVGYACCARTRGQVRVFGGGHGWGVCGQGRAGAAHEAGVRPMRARGAAGPGGLCAAVWRVGE